MIDGSANTEGLNLRSIMNATLKPENIKVLTEGSIDSNYRQILPVSLNQLVFNQGHSPNLYVKGASIVKDDDVYEVRKEDEEAERFIVINSDTIIGNPSFRTNLDLQSIIVDFINQEVNNSQVGYLQYYLKDLQKPGLQGEPDRFEEVKRGFEFQRHNIEPEEISHLESVQYFLSKAHAERLPITQTASFRNIVDNVNELLHFSKTPIEGLLTNSN